MSGDADHAPGQVIQQMLEDLGIGHVPPESGVITADWPIFWDYLPDAPDNAICVYDTDPRNQGRIHFTGEQIEQYGIQVRVRGTSVELTQLKAKSVAVAFDSHVLRRQVTVDTPAAIAGYVVQSVNRVSGPIRLGVEAGVSRRRSFTINAVTSLRMDDVGTGTGTGTS